MTAREGWKRVGEWQRTRLFPPACFVCSRLLDLYDADEKRGALCRECLGEWEKAKRERCPLCGEEISSCGCMPAEVQMAGCRAMRRLVYYRRGIGDPVQNRLIYRFKRKRSRRTAQFLAAELQPLLEEMMAYEGMRPEDTLLIPIPRSRAAYLAYGTDQAEALAAALSDGTGLASERVLLHVGRNAKKQKEQLTVEERVRNAQRSYRLRSGASIKGKHVVLLDDIVTSGATVAACARKLRRRGVAGIYALSIATDES